MRAPKRQPYRVAAPVGEEVWPWWLAVVILVVAGVVGALLGGCASRTSNPDKISDTTTGLALGTECYASHECLSGCCQGGVLEVCVTPGVSALGCNCITDIDCPVTETCELSPTEGLYTCQLTRQ